MASRATILQQLRNLFRPVVGVIVRSGATSDGYDCNTYRGYEVDQVKLIKKMVSRTTILQQLILLFGM